MYFKLAIYVMKVFLKVPKNACFSAQNILDPLLSLYLYFFIPKVERQENAEFKKIEK